VSSGSAAIVKLLLDKQEVQQPSKVIPSAGRRISSPAKPPNTLTRRASSPSTSLLSLTPSSPTSPTRVGLTEKNILNAEDREGYTPLLLAVEKGHWDIAKLLMDAGAGNGA
jgi:hypothetical protein